MNMQTILMDPLRSLFERLYLFLPHFLGAILILAIGWVVARILHDLLVKTLKSLRVDEFLSRAGVHDILSKGGVTYTVSGLMGLFLYWLILLIALVAAMNALELTVAAELLNRIVLYIPSVLEGIIILIMGAFFASMVGSLVQTVTANAGIKHGPMLGQVTRVVIVVFAIEVALEKFIGITTLHTQLNIVIAAVAFGAALAFGLGCKDLAGRYMEELVEKFRRG